MQPGTGGGLLQRRRYEDSFGNHEPLRGAAGLPGPGQPRVEGSLPAPAAEPPGQRPVDPGLHGQRRGGARGVDASPHLAARRGRADGLPLAEAPPRRQRVRCCLGGRGGALGGAAAISNNCQRHKKGIKER